MAPVDDEIMPLGLARNSFIDGGIDEFIVFRCAQRGAEISRVFLAEAHEERADETHTAAENSL